METIKALDARVGGLSNPSKMPGFSYGIPAASCPVGSILRGRAGSTCSKCYAHKGWYLVRVVKKAQERRLAIVQRDMGQWADDMIILIGRKLKKKEKVFRWHDSGDILNREHLDAIVRIAEALPDVRFWLPTREYATIRAFVRDRGSFPNNLIVRVSAAMIGGSIEPITGTVSSTVGTGTGYVCPAYTQDGKCGDCRACWKKSVKSVDYPLH